MLLCPKCESQCVKKNGHIYSGKQNYCCLDCGRQFVENPSKKTIDKKTRDSIDLALSDSMDPEEICERFSVSSSWLNKFMSERES